MARNINKGILGILLMAILLWGSSLWGAQDIPRVFTLDNGLTVILQENRSAPVVAIHVWVRTGSADEGDDEAGISHVLEHMMFKGTRRLGVGEISRAVEGAGGYINASTSSDSTTYYIVMPSRDFQTGVEIMADVLQHPALNEEELQKEREVILEEIRRLEDQPFSRLSKALFNAAYGHHPYRRPVIGFEKIVRQISRPMLLDFVHRWYRPANMILVMVGDAPLEQMEKSVRRHFTDVSGGRPPERRRPVEPLQESFRSVVLSGNVSKAYMAMGWHIPGVRNEETYALDVLALILGQGRSSRLYREVLSRRKLVHMITSLSYTPQDPGLFWIQATLEPGNDALHKALEAILSETYRLKSTLVEPEELEKAKLNLESGFVYGKQTMQAQARSLGYSQMIHGNVSFERHYVDRIRQVDADDLRQAARRYLRTENLTLALMKPSEIPSPDEATLEQISRKAENETNLARKEQGARESDGVWHRVLPNGMTLIIKKKSDVPIVALRAVLLGGVRFETAENNGINHFMARMLTRGTASRSAEALALEVESIAGRMQGFSGLNSFGLSAEFLSRFRDRGFELFTDVLLRPSFDPDEMEKMRTLILSSIDQIRDQPDTLAIDYFVQNLFRIHPYRMRIEGTRESISRLTVEDLRSYYNRYVVPANMVLTVVGDVDPEAVAERIQSLFAWDSRGELVVPIPPQEILPTEIRRERITREAQQTHIVLGFIGPSLDSPARFPMTVLNTILSGMGGRLFSRLRDRESLAYSVSFFTRYGLDPGFFGVYMGTSPEKLQRAEEEILRELRDLRENLVTEEELERAKRLIIGQHAIGLQQNSAQAAELAFDVRYGLGIDYTSDYLSRIQSVTREDVLKVARRYIDLDSYTLTIVGP